MPRVFRKGVLTALWAAVVGGTCYIAVLGGLLAQVLPPAVWTDRTGYLVGETVVINGSGFAPDEVVTLQVVHADGSAANDAGHQPFTVTADSAGAFSTSWLLNEDPAGNNFVVLALGTTTPAQVPVPFKRIARVETDKYDYIAGETAVISGAGFRAGEDVVLRVEHSNGLNDGAGHEPFTVQAGDDGRILTAWYVHPDDSDGAIFRLSAAGAASGVQATWTFTDPVPMLVDDGGADDEPGQKDLNFLSVDYAGSPDLAVVWGWDDIKWSGQNTGDACALFDTDADGHANFSLCITVDQSGNYQSTRLYA
jgi:hypothetical protein